MKARARSAVAVLLMSFAYVPLTFAQPTTADKALATRLYSDAEKLMASGDFAGACPKFAESQRSDPQLGTLLHLADCYEKAGKLVSAWVSFNEAVEFAARKNASGANDPRGKTARDRAAALEGKLSNLVINVTNGDAPGFEIRQDDAVVARAAWGSAIPVDPGSYAITAKATGKKPWSTKAEVPSNGLKVEVTVPPLEDDAGAAQAGTGAPAGGPMTGAPMMGAPMTGAPMGQQPPPGAPPPPSPDAPTPANSQRTIGWIVGGVGVVGVGLGAVFGLMSKSKVSDRDALCPQTDCPRSNVVAYLDAEKSAQTDATVATVSFIVGGAAIAGGLALVLFSPSSQPAQGAVRIAPWIASNGSGAVIGGAW